MAHNNQTDHLGVLEKQVTRAVDGQFHNLNIDE